MTAADDDHAATAAAGNDETEIVPPPTEEAPELAWSQPEADATETIGRRSWHSASLLSAALVAGGSLLAIAVSFGFWVAHQASTPPPRQPVPAPSSTAAAPITQTVPQQTASAPTTTLATTTVAPPRKPALPVAIEGSPCRLQSTPTVDPDGVTVYCALFPDMPLTAMWSRTPGPLAWPTIGGVRVPDQAGSYPWVVVCEQQTGRSYNYCETAIAQATYQGDGPVPVE